MRYGSVCSGIAVGDKFGRLTVTEIYAPKRRDQFRIKCMCDCGVEVDTVGSKLRHRKTRSCGCLRRDRLGDMFRTHGKSQTAEYIMFYDARKRAIAKGIPFKITPDDIVIPKYCPVLGIELTIAGSGARNSRPSLDRIVPYKGYVLGNVSVISFRANRLKSDATPEELRCILQYMEGVEW